jgi:hypothetical protein
MKLCLYAGLFASIQQGSIDVETQLQANQDVYTSGLQKPFAGRHDNQIPFGKAQNKLAMRSAIVQSGPENAPLGLDKQDDWRAYHARRSNDPQSHAPPRETNRKASGRVERDRTVGKQGICTRTGKILHNHQ